MSQSTTSLLDLPDDVIIYIVAFIANGVNHPILRPISQLKALALLHPRFLSPARSRLYRNPDLTRAPKVVYVEPSRGREGYYRNAPHLMQPVQQEIGPLRALVDALVSNPALGSYVKSFDRLGMHNQVLGRTFISPLAVSNAIVTILGKVTSLTELELPKVDLKDVEKLIAAVCSMSNLKVLRLSPSGCTRTTDQSCYNFHEGDLRRIAKDCKELEELYISTENVGFGDQGYVEAFAFKKLKILNLDRATSLTNHHLRAILAQATGLNELIIRRSAVVEATPKDRLTTSGIADVLEMRGSTLKKLVIDIAPRCHNYSENESHITGSTPAVEAALANCSQLTDLTLLGPGLVNSTALHRLGSPIPTTTTHSFGMPAYTPKNKHAGLAYLERLFLGVYPPNYDGLVSLLDSLVPGSNTPFAALTQVTLTYPPANCSGYAEAVENVTRLKSILQVDPQTNQQIDLVLISPPYEDGRAWARGDDSTAATTRISRRQPNTFLGMPIPTVARGLPIIPPTNATATATNPAAVPANPTTANNPPTTATTSATTDTSAIIADVDSEGEEYDQGEDEDGDGGRGMFGGFIGFGIRRGFYEEDV